MAYKQSYAGSILDDYEEKGNGLSRLSCHIVQHVRAFEISPEHENLSRTDVHDLAEGFGSSKISAKLAGLFNKDYLKETEEGLSTTEKARQEL